MGQRRAGVVLHVQGVLPQVGAPRFRPGEHLHGQEDVQHGPELQQSAKGEAPAVEAAGPGLLGQHQPAEQEPAEHEEEVDAGPAEAARRCGERVQDDIAAALAAEVPAEREEDRQPADDVEIETPAVRRLPAEGSGVRGRARRNGHPVDVMSPLPTAPVGSRSDLSPFAIGPDGATVACPGSHGRTSPSHPSGESDEGAGSSRRSRVPITPSGDRGTLPPHRLPSVRRRRRARTVRARRGGHRRDP